MVVIQNVTSSSPTQEEEEEEDAFRPSLENGSKHATPSPTGGGGGGGGGVAYRPPSFPLNTKEETMQKKEEEAIGEEGEMGLDSDLILFDQVFGSPDRNETSKEAMDEEEYEDSQEYLEKRRDYQRKFFYLKASFLKWTIMSTNAYFSFSSKHFLELFFFLI